MRFARVGNRPIAWMLSAALLAVVPSPVSAWWDSGHRIVALVAWSQMSPAVRSRVLAALDHHPQAREYFTPPPKFQGGIEFQRQWIISQAAVWSDLVRKTDRDRPTWHYINRPVFLSASERKILSAKLKINVATALPADVSLATRDLNVIQALAFCRKRLVARGGSQADRALCITWICHLVGDVHQPCHSTATFSTRRFPTGDRGGNDIPIARTGGDTNLHMVWDGQFGGSRTLESGVVRRAASLLADPRLVAAGHRAAKRLEAETWVEESHRLAREVVYHPAILDAIRRAERDPGQPIPPITLPKGYSGQAAAVAGRRVVEAGFRLAKLLSQIP
ncbi:MAG: S1/P1 nuclease [Planctomycetaceae bacterium]